MNPNRGYSWALSAVLIGLRSTLNLQVEVIDYPHLGLKLQLKKAGHWGGAGVQDLVFQRFSIQGPGFTVQDNKTLNPNQILDPEPCLSEVQGL